MLELKNVLDDQYTEQFQTAATAGIDIGSRGAKGVILYKGKIYYKNIASGVSSIESGKQLLTELLKEAGITNSDLEYIVGTGYGRVALEFDNIPFAGITEISCHAKGAHYLNSDTSTIIDIGGQDSKAIKINSRDGNVVEFIMNDKCAAGTGRFLEKVAQLLELNLKELGEAAVLSKNPIEISSQCVVFAESEVVSLKAKNASKEDIAAGIHIATARRVQSLLRRIDVTEGVLFTGGVSKNQGMVKAIEEVLEVKLASTKFDTTYAGALGAAIFASEYADAVRQSYGGAL